MVSALIAVCGQVNLDVVDQVLCRGHGSTHVEGRCLRATDQSSKQMLDWLRRRVSTSHVLGNVGAKRVTRPFCAHHLGRVSSSCTGQIVHLAVSQRVLWYFAQNSLSSGGGVVGNNNRLFSC